MLGGEDTSGAIDDAAKDDDDADSDNGSEDLEADSSGSEDEEIEEEEAEGDVDEDMDMGEDGEAKPAATEGQSEHAVEPSHGEVMVH